MERTKLLKKAFKRKTKNMKKFLIHNFLRKFTSLFFVLFMVLFCFWGLLHEFCEFMWWPETVGAQTSLPRSCKWSMDDLPLQITLSRFDWTNRLWRLLNKYLTIQDFCKEASKILNDKRGVYSLVASQQGLAFNTRIQCNSLVWSKKGTKNYLLFRYGLWSCSSFAHFQGALPFVCSPFVFFLLFFLFSLQIFACFIFFFSFFQDCFLFLFFSLLLSLFPLLIFLSCLFLHLIITKINLTFISMLCNGGVRTFQDLKEYVHLVANPKDRNLLEKNIKKRKLTKNWNHFQQRLQGGYPYQTDRKT